MSRRKPQKAVNDPAKRETFLYGVLRHSWGRFLLRLFFFFLAISIAALWITLEDVIYDQNHERWEQEELSLEQQFFASPEWAAFIGSREEWTDAHEAAAPLVEPTPVWGDDPFYLSPEAYYRIQDMAHQSSGVYATLGEIGSRTKGEIQLALSGVSHLFFCEVEFSDLSYWRFICTADRKRNLLSVDYEFYPDDQRIYFTNMSEVDSLRTYLEQRTAELTNSDLWRETIGEDYSVPGSPYPTYAYLSANAGSTDITYMGYEGWAQMDDALWRVRIPVAYDRQTKQYYEQLLTIQPW